MAALPSGMATRPFDRSKMEAAVNADDGLTHIVPVTSFETFMAKAMETENRSAAIVCEEIVNESREIIAFFEEFPGRAVIVDIEEVTHSPASGELSAVDIEPWLRVLIDSCAEASLPAPLARLGWMEQRCAFGSHAERVFDTLEACTRPLIRPRPPNAEAGSSSAIVSRRTRLIEESERQMADLYSVLADKEKEISEAYRQPLEDLTSKNATLEQALEKATISQEISDLLIAQLQEELEMVVSDPTTAYGHPESTSDQAQADVLQSIGNPQAAGESAPTSQQQTRKRPRHGFKRWALSVCMAPSTRARIRQIKASDLFDSDWYVATYPDIADSPMTPEHHFLKFGAAEYRDPSPKFSTQRYLWQHPEVDASAENPLLHWLNSARD